MTAHLHESVTTGLAAVASSRDETNGFLSRMAAPGLRLAHQ